MEPIEITTPIGKHKVKLKAFVTGRDKQTIESVFLEGTTISGQGAADMKGSLALEAINKALSIVVLEVDGATGDEVLNKVLDMHSTDYDFVRTEVDKITNPLDEKKSGK